MSPSMAQSSLCGNGGLRSNDNFIASKNLVKKEKFQMRSIWRQEWSVKVFGSGIKLYNNGKRSFSCFRHICVRGFSVYWERLYRINKRFGSGIKSWKVWKRQLCVSSKNWPEWKIIKCGALNLFWSVHSQVNLSFS